MSSIAPRLTSLAHGGGCGCKLSPAALRSILAQMPALPVPAELLVGTETGDDAAVYRLNPAQALVATTDFFTPIVDDPFDFGRIAATNALSDIYAMGGTPILALAIVGMPLERMALEVVQRILAGGAAACAGAGIVVAGGHSIDSAEPIYGLAAIGLVHPDRLLRNSGARAGDALILTKGLGVGVFGAALRRGALDPAGYAAMLASTTRLNDIGPALAERAEVHAATDVTGFGLLGHLLEMCEGAGLSADLRLDQVPLLAGAEALARDGFATGAAARNWQSYGTKIECSRELPEWRRSLLCDPQTSGGLLLAVAPGAIGAVTAQLAAAGHGHAVVGHMRAGIAGVAVT